MNIIEKKEHKYSGMVTKLHREVLLRQPGDQLLSEPALAQKFDVSRGTARKALKTLEDLGCIIRKQGQGTFVKEVDDSAAARGEYVFLSFGIDDGNPYIFNQLRGIEQFVTRNNGVAIYKSADDKSLLGGDIETFFRRTNVQGILVDGDINDMHMHSLQAMNIPLVVMGNHNISADFSQVSYDFSLTSELVCQYLLSLEHGPVRLLINDDSQLFYFKQMIEAYNNVMFRNEENPAIYAPNEHDYKQVFSIIKGLTDRNKDKFCLYTVDNVVPYVLQSLDWLGYSDNKIPIIALGSGVTLKEEHLQRIKLVQTDPYLVGQKATEILMGVTERSQRCHGVFSPELNMKSADKFDQFEFRWNYKVSTVDSGILIRFAGIRDKNTA